MKMEGFVCRVRLKVKISLWRAIKLRIAGGMPKILRRKITIEELVDR